MPEIDGLAAALAAAADATRLRLLKACELEPQRVGQLARALGLPEPAVSRHLKILAAAKLLLRQRSGREVSYSLAVPAPWLVACLGQLDQANELTQRDRRRLQHLAAEATGVAAPFVPASALGQALLRHCAESGPGHLPQRALLLWPQHGELLRWFAASARAPQIFDGEPLRRATVNRFAAQSGLRLRWVSANADGDALEAPAPCSFLLAQAAAASHWALLQRWIPTLLAPQGQLLLTIPYDVLDDSTAEGHPLFQLRSALTRLGLHCERLAPVEVGGVHILVASASHRAASGSERGSAAR
jgi:ArsR family transcriptional regulator